MNTITINNLPHTKIRKNFSTPLEAGYYLIGLSMKSNQTTRKKSKRDLAMEEYKRGETVDGAAFLKKLIASK